MLLGIHVSKNFKISKDKSKTISESIIRDV